MPDLALPVGTFLRISISEYRKTLNGTELSAKMLDEALEKAATAWIAHRKPKRVKKPVIEDEAAWIESLRASPSLAGVDLDKEVAKCRFWCSNQSPPVMCSRRRLVNWLNRADRLVGTGKSAAPAPNPGPVGWLDWVRENMPGWRRIAEEAQGTPIPTWDKLESIERNAILAGMKGKT